MAVPSTSSSDPPALASWPRGSGPAWMLAVALTLPELVLWGADRGLWGSLAWRPMAYSWGAFWAGLLHGWQPNFAAQPLVMFLTYGFLHAGPVHLAGNLGALAYLVPSICWRTGWSGFFAIWVGSWLGGAAMFGLISQQTAPMVGASGALFGLAGAWLVWALRERLAAGLPPRRTLLRGAGAALVLVAINLADWWLQRGQLAWQTHLGGALVGAGLGAVLQGKRRRLISARGKSRI